MKKLFTILAAALFVVACGGGNAKNEPKSLEDQFLEHLAKMEKAMEAKDWKKTSEACNAFWEWDDSLDEEQSEELDEIIGSKEEYWTLLGAAIDAANYGYDEICEDDEPEVLMVYSNCYDGYLNVRAEPSSNAAIVGELRNGPQGAELLGVEGKWSKVRVNGVVGYVFSSYLQSEPTDPVSINAAAVVGDWYSEEFEGGNWYDKITVKSNGQCYREYWLGVDMNDRIDGTWYLSRNKLVLKWADGTVDSCTVNGKYLNWDGTKFYRM